MKEKNYIFQIYNAVYKGTASPTATLQLHPCNAARSFAREKEKCTLVLWSYFLICKTSLIITVLNLF